MIPVFDSLSAGAMLLLAILIFTNPRKTNRKANLWLSVFTLCIYTQMMDSVLYELKVFYDYPHLLGISNLFFFLITPTFYFAVSNFISPDRAFQKKDAWHFIVFFVYTLVILPFFLKSGEAKIKLMEEGDVSLIDYIIVAVVLIYTLVYWFFSFRSINRHQNNLQMILSKEGPANLHWLRYFMVALLGMIILWGIGNFIGLKWVEYVSSILYLLMAFALSYYALHQEEVYSFNKQERKEIKALIQQNNAEIGQEKKNLLSDEDLESIKHRLSLLMEQDKPYLDNDLNLLKLAEMLHSSIHILSYTINEGFGENFSQYVNRYRVEEAKKLLINPDLSHLNMLGIAFQAGFNSKTAFNTTFKKLAGMSPSEYKNLQAKQAPAYV